jgi:hypothetical protein
VQFTELVGTAHEQAHTGCAPHLSAAGGPSCAELNKDRLLAGDSTVEGGFGEVHPAAHRSELSDEQGYSSHLRGTAVSRQIPEIAVSGNPRKTVQW